LVKSGRSATVFIAIFDASCMRGNDGVVMTQPIVSANLADCASFTSPGCGSYGGTPGWSPKYALSIASAVAPGMRSPINRLSDIGL